MFHLDDLPTGKKWSLHSPGQAEHLDFFQKQLGFEMVDFADREAGFGGGFFRFSVVHFPGGNAYWTCWFFDQM
jgi:hypothetical protein